MDINDIINKYPDFSFNIKGTDLREFGKNIAVETAQHILKHQEEDPYTREELMKKFEICDTTLWRRQKNGDINVIKLGNRNYYNRNEIRRLLKERETPGNNKYKLDEE